MPIEVSIWKLGKTIDRVQFTPMPSEEQLEENIAGDIGILDPSLLLIGRQVLTCYGKYIDLLAMDADRKLVVIEAELARREGREYESAAQLLERIAATREMIKAKTKHKKGKCVSR